MNNNLFCIYQNTIYKINQINKLKIYEIIKRNFEKDNVRHRYHNINIDINFNISTLDDNNKINLILENVQLSSNAIIFANNIEVAKLILNNNLSNLKKERILNLENKKKKLLLLKDPLEIKIHNYQIKIDEYEKRINEIQQEIEKAKCDA